ncbi:hypothetical protein JZ751_029256 [Albula glossodonta]|uniref:DUF4537 domain-containing protein n=1 Tax=Albula glossodonta TaxID=121402 RepID=A0A8T2P9L8_9TELE|nr:hypothetical protein JZ751_029256 [Albula glossodonta]
MVLDAETGIPEYVRTARLLLPKVSPGQEVLARWAQDGWYHRSSVVHSCGDQSYFLQSKEGALERVWREDIITERDDSSQEVKEEDPIIGAHPLYPERYCPGVVLAITGDLQVKVRYYDGTEVLVLREQIFLIPAQKFERDVAYLLECEERWVGQPDREWIFGKWSWSRALTVGDYMLAPIRHSPLTFLPGVVQGTSGTVLHIQFINGKSCQPAETHHCFWLSEEQFSTAAQHYNSQRQRGTVEEEDEDKEGQGEEGSEDELDESVYSSDSSTSSL